MTELSQQDIRALFDAMGEELASHGAEFTFVQLRISAERFVVPLFGVALDRSVRALMPSQYHVYFERKPRSFTKGPVDLLLVPAADNGAEDWDAPYCFEFKMVWRNSIKENLDGIRQDLVKLSGYDRGFVVAVLFSFERSPGWTPYAHEGAMGQLAEDVVSGIGAPFYEGREHSVANHEAAGKAKLMAWSAGADVARATIEEPQ